MIRKAIIVVLTLAAVGISIIAVAAAFRPASMPSTRFVLFGDNSLQRSGIGEVEVWEHKGHIVVEHCRRLKAPTPPKGREHAARFTNAEFFSGIGVNFHDTSIPIFDTTGALTTVYVSVSLAWAPAWVLISLLILYPTIAFIRGPLRRWRRRRKGLCLKCGYDLTGNVSGVCPECATEIEQP